MIIKYITSRGLKCSLVTDTNNGMAFIAIIEHTPSMKLISIKGR